MTTKTNAAAMPKPDLLTRLLVLVLLIIKFFRREPAPIEKVRARVAKRERRLKLKLPEGISQTDITLNNVPCSLLENDSPDNDRLVLYLHGGAMCLRYPTTETNCIAPFCKAIGAKSAILPWYRLSPEDKFPAGLDDCFAVYKQLLEQGQDPSKIVLSGISAGGGYSFALLSLIKQNNLPMPGCAILISPSGDGLFVGESFHQNNLKDPAFYCSDVIYYQNLLLSPEQVADPLLNVSLMDDFSGYPPLYLTASTHEVLRDVSVMAADKAKAAKIPHQLDLFQGGFHAMHMVSFPRQSKVGWERIRQFVESHVPSEAAS